MNPPEGAAEEAGAADSDVDAFFRTGRLGRARTAGGWAAAWDAASRTSLGKQGCCWGVRVGGQLPSSSGLEFPRFLLLWQCRSRFGAGWGLGARRPSAFTPLAGVCGGEAGGGSLGRLLRERGDGARLDHFAARRSRYPRPGPSLGPSPPRACQPRSGRPGLAPLLGPGSRRPDMLRWAVGTPSHAGCRLTGAGRTQDGPAGVCGEPAS